MIPQDFGGIPPGPLSPQSAAELNRALEHLRRISNLNTSPPLLLSDSAGGIHLSINTPEIAIVRITHIGVFHSVQNSGNFAFDGEIFKLSATNGMLEDAGTCWIKPLGWGLFYGGDTYDTPEYHSHPAYANTEQLFLGIKFGTWTTTNINSTNEPTRPLYYIWYYGHGFTKNKHLIGYPMQRWPSFPILNVGYLTNNNYIFFGDPPRLDGNYMMPWIRGEYDNYTTGTGTGTIGDFTGSYLELSGGCRDPLATYNGWGIGGAFIQLIGGNDPSGVPVTFPRNAGPSSYERYIFLAGNVQISEELHCGGSIPGLWTTHTLSGDVLVKRDVANSQGGDLTVQHDLMLSNNLVISGKIYRPPGTGTGTGDLEGGVIIDDSLQVRGALLIGQGAGGLWPELFSFGATLTLRGNLEITGSLTVGGGTLATEAYVQAYVAGATINGGTW